MTTNEPNPYEPPTNDDHKQVLPPNSHGQGDATGGVIPYKNVPALLAYYFGVFCLVPCFTPLLCLPALILGIVGLKKAKEQPQAKGQVHAWIGVVMGAGGMLFTLAVLVLWVIALANA